MPRSPERRTAPVTVERPGPEVKPARRRERGVRGLGSVTEDRANRRWLVRGPWDGRKKHYFKSRAEAENARRTMAGQARAAAGALKDPNITLEVWAEAWWETRAGGNPRTNSTDRSKLQVLLSYLGRTRMRDITREVCREYVNETLVDQEGYEPQMRKHHQALLRKILQAAIDADVAIGKNPASRLKVTGFDPDEAFRPTILSRSQWDALRAAAATVDRNRAAVRREVPLLPVAGLIDLSLYMCIRQGELLGLTWNRVLDLWSDEPRLAIMQQLQPNHGSPQNDAIYRFEGSSLEIVPLKSSKGRRTVVLHEKCTAPLREVHQVQQHRKAIDPDWNPAGLVFPAEDGLAMHAKELWVNVFEPVCRVAEIPLRRDDELLGVRWHDLRHTGITYRARRQPIPSLQRFAGHSTHMTTMKYVTFAGSLEEDHLIREAGEQLP